MGGSSKKAAPVATTPSTAGGPMPVLGQTQTYYPNYPTYVPQSSVGMGGSSIGLTIPSDLNSLRQTAMSSPSPMLISRASFIPRINAPNAMVRNPPVQTFQNVPMPNLTPVAAAPAVNPEMERMRQELDQLRAWQSQTQNGGYQGNSN